jgi:hypothetical protein
MARSGRFASRRLLLPAGLSGLALQNGKLRDGCGDQLRAFGLQHVGEHVDGGGRVGLNLVDKRVKPALIAVGCAWNSYRYLPLTPRRTVVRMADDLTNTRKRELAANASRAKQAHPSVPGSGTGVTSVNSGPENSALLKPA